MNNADVNKKIQALLSGMNQEALKNGAQSIDKILNSPQGKKLVNSLSGADKQRIISTFMNMSNDEIRKKLKNVNKADLEGISAEDILKKLR